MFNKDSNFILSNGVVAHNCKSHAFGYSKLAYTCAYLKRHFPLEWWTAVLKNASKDEINETFWRHCSSLIKLPDLKNSTESFEIIGNQIQAPLSLLHGVGEKAHHQIQLYRPYADIYDFCNKIHKHKEAGAVKGIKIKTKKKKIKDKETGITLKYEEKEETPTVRLGSSALNRGTIYSLIVAGTMDALFPEGLTLVEQLAEFEKAYAASTNEKVKGVKPEYVSIGPLERFQVRKDILPAYSTNLTHLVADLKAGGVKFDDKKRPVYTHERHLRSGDVRKTDYRIVSFNELERINSLPILPEGGIKLAVVAYVQEASRFSYGPNKEKDAFKGNFDIDGGRLEMVKWPDRDGKLEKTLTEENLTGAIVVLQLNKYRADKDTSVESIHVIQKPLDLKAEKE